MKNTDPKVRIPIPWETEIKVGTILPHDRIEYTIWPQSMWYPETVLHPALAYGSGKTAKVRFVREFYGWDADLVSDFLKLPGWVRYSGGSALIGLLFGTTLFWRRRRTKARTPALSNPEPTTGATATIRDAPLVIEDSPKAE